MTSDVATASSMGCGNFPDPLWRNISENVTDNTTTLLSSVDSTPPWVYLVIGVCVAVMGVIGIIGNGTVICLFLRYRILRSAANTFVFSMACTDLLMCLVNFPIFSTANITGAWPLPPVSCQVTGFVASLAGYISINTLAAMAVDRCSVIKRTKPITGRSSRSSMVLTVVGIWLYSGVWAALPLVGWGRYVRYGPTVCSFDFESKDTNNVSFIIGIYVFCFTLQFLIIVLCYSSIFATIYFHDRKLSKMKVILTNGRERRTVSRRMLELKVARLVLFIIFFFCLSWAPYAILALINMFGCPSLVTPIGVVLAGALAKTSTVMNPLIYAIYAPRFRNCISLCCRTGIDDAKRSYIPSTHNHPTIHNTSSRRSLTNNSHPSHVRRIGECVGERRSCSTE
ncbi:rhodopsin-like [Haliotis rufescens]|uniref:rhodopsin-like n=1 Tax=Haliotis rufescens TaxID=6454 RepID=UPI001EAFC4D6|nr:rhodopsin-like [Haliotis rufescens]